MAEVNNDAFSEEAVKVVETKLEEFKNLSFNEAAGLPGATLDDIVIAGKEVQMTVFRQQGVPESPDAILVTVQLTRAGLGGVINYQYERALVYAENGEIREATESELLATGG